jgi:hypothetical protein
MRAFVAVPLAAALSAAVVPPAIAEDTITAPPGYVTSMTAGQPDPNGKVPAYNAVPGAGVDNFSVAATQAVLTHGLVYTFSISLQDSTYTGNVEVYCEITQKIGTKTTVLVKQIINKQFASSPGNYWLWSINGPAIPNSPGAATLTGFAKFGKATVKLSEPILLR